MPSASRYVPPSDPERSTFSITTGSELRQRKANYKTAVDYYLGNQDEPTDEEDIDISYINMVKMTADRTVSFLFPNIPQIQTDPASLQDTPEEKYIKDVIKANGGLKWLNKLGLRGFLAGHNFVYVKPASKRLRGSSKVFPSLNLLDPTTVQVFWRAADVSDVVWYEQRYYVGETLYLKDFINEGEVWRIITYKGTPKNDNPLAQVPTNYGKATLPNLDNIDWDGLKWTQIETAIHSSSIPPIIEWAHLPHPDSYYGLGEADQKKQQDAINKLATERMRIIRQHSEPIDFVSGVDADDIVDEGSVLSTSSANARITRLEMRGDLTGLTMVLDKNIETYLSVARVVLLKGEAKDLQRVTNAAVRTLFLDALSKNGVLQATYGEGLSDIARLILQMGYAAGDIQTDPSDLDITVGFGSALPVDLKEVADVNAIGIATGWMSQRTAATLANLNYAFEMANIKAHEMEFPVDKPE